MKNYFEVEAQRYSDLYNSLTWNVYITFYLNYRLKKVLSSIKFTDSIRAIDVGCGPGKLLKELEKLENIKLLIGCDSSASMLKIAKENVSNKVNLYQAKASSLPFPNKYFNCVFSIGVLPYMKEPLKGLKEIYRILSSDGIACITYPYKKTLLSFFRENPVGIWLRKNLLKIAHYHVKYEREKFIEMIEEIGFKIVSEERLHLSEFLLVLKRGNKRVK